MERLRFCAGSTFHIDHNKLFLKRGALAEQIARRVEREAVAVENQFVIAAHEVAVHDGNAVFPRHTLEHVMTVALLAQMIRRRGHVQNRLRMQLASHQLMDRAAFVELCRQIILRPNVLANRQAQALTAEADHRIGVSGLEIAVFVEYIVRGQQHLLAAGDRFPVLDERDRVHVVTARALGVEIHVTDEQRGWADLRGQFVQYPQVVVNKAVFGEQIARRITRDGHLRSHDQVGAGRDCAAVEIKNPGGVPA